MSDCFNHAADAMDSYITCHGEGLDEPNFTPQITRTLYVNEFITFTEKAMLVKVGNSKFWVPISQVKGCSNTSIDITQWLFDRLKPIRE